MTTFYDDVILFDTGTYNIEKIDDFGVSFYRLTLKGRECDYKFRAYSPKFRAVDELLPYMSPQKSEKSFKRY